ncbi:histidine phosphatase family protein [Janthinobacterium lividum]|uniref:histidine phosphatase family protein n=1 Tax=Janthinobacterium lividum TaxID=29581 RepID=UPI0033AC3267
MRHGQSAGNVARDAAEAEKQLLIAIAERDVDVPLSELGTRQAQALGDWFATLPLNNNRPSCCIRRTCGRSRRRNPCWRASTRTA